MAPLVGDMDLVLVVRLFYLVCAVAILSARLLPPLRQRFLVYGARSHVEKTKQTDCPCQDSRDGLGTRSLTRLAAITVPHRWFTHFYIWSTACSIFYLAQMYGRGKFLMWTAAYVHSGTRKHSTSTTQLCMLLMLMQSIRRLIESVVFAKSSASTMWLGHYVFGLAFYTFTNLALWIEAAPTLVRSDHTLHVDIATLLSVRVCIGLFLFIVASASQYQAHSYLASLKKYTLPQQWLFRRLVAPHYTAECIIYVSLAVIAAPDRAPVNITLLCTVLLAAVNLGITAEGTKQWMLDKFREHNRAIQGRWILIPAMW